MNSSAEAIYTCMLVSVVAANDDLGNEGFFNEWQNQSPGLAFDIVTCNIVGPAYEVLILIAIASSLDSDEPARPRSIVRAFAPRTLNSGGSRISGKGVNMYKGVGVRFC